MYFFFKSNPWVFLSLGWVNWFVFLALVLYALITGPAEKRLSGLLVLLFVIVLGGALLAGTIAVAGSA